MVSRGIRSPLCAAVLVATACGALAPGVRVAHAQAAASKPARSRVAIVTRPDATTASRDAARRLVAELEAQGLEVITLERSGSTTPAVVDGAAPFAIVTLDEASAGPEARVLILVGEPVDLRVDAGDLSEDAARGGLAIRVVERLRAGLVELARDEKTPRELPPDVAAFAGVPQATAPSPRGNGRADQMAVAPPSSPGAPPRLGGSPDWPSPPLTPVERPPLSTWLGVGAETIVGYGGIGAALGPRVDVALDLPARFTVELAASVDFGLVTIEGDRGSATTRHFLVVAGASHAFDVSSSSFSPRLGALAGVHVLQVEGEAEPNEGRAASATGAAFAAGAGVGAEVYASERLRFIADVSVLFVVPQPVIVIVEEEAAKGGYPMFAIRIGGEVRP